mgnify:CR=1 FL=1
MRRRRLRSLEQVLPCPKKSESADNDKSENWCAVRRSVDVFTNLLVMLCMCFAQAILLKKETQAQRNEMAAKVARRKALEQEDQEKFDASRRPPPKTIVGEIRDWYDDVVKNQVDYATHKANEARAKLLREQAERRKKEKPSNGPARYFFEFPSPLVRY